MRGCLRTVLGDIDISGVGHTQPHEHLVADSSIQAQRLATSSEATLETAGIYERDRHRITEPINLHNHYWIRRHVFNTHNLALDDQSTMVAELGLFRDRGGHAIVDCTPEGLGRDPDRLVELSRASGVHVVMGCGFYIQSFHPPEVADASETELADRMIRDVVAGVGADSVKSGVIGEIGVSWPIHPSETKVLRAAGLAQRETKAGLQVHPGRHPSAPIEALNVLEATGADISKVSISHVERTIFDLDGMIELAQRGPYLEFDLFGQESSYYPYAPIDLPNDAGRERMIRAIADAGHLRQLLMSQDLGYKTLLSAFGGPGYAHLLENVLPEMRRQGFSDVEIHQLTVANPLRFLALEA